MTRNGTSDDPRSDDRSPADPDGCEAVVASGSPSDTEAEPLYEGWVELDWGGGLLMFSSNAAAQEKFDVAVDYDLLPISDDLRDALEEIVPWYDDSMNWANMDAPGPWRQDECDRFNNTTRDLFRRLCDELGPTWDITRKFGGVDEDPDLDRYLADPENFRRRAQPPIELLRPARERQDLTFGTVGLWDMLVSSHWYGQDDWTVTQLRDIQPQYAAKTDARLAELTAAGMVTISSSGVVTINPDHLGKIPPPPT